MDMATEVTAEDDGNQQENETNLLNLEPAPDVVFVASETMCRYLTLRNDGN